METETTQTTTTGLTHLTNIIGALALHASTDPQRGCLQAIYITPQHLTATDSYTLAQWIPTEPITIGEPVIIDAKNLTTALNNLTKATKQYSDAQAHLTITGGHTWRLSATNETTEIGNYNGQTINSEYPNTKQLLERTTCEQFEPTGFNPEYLERLTKASRKISKITPLEMAQWQTPQKPVLWITTTDTGTLTQLIMPQRINTK